MTVGIDFSLKITNGWLFSRPAYEEVTWEQNP